MELLDRLDRQIELHDSGCWIWLGYPNKHTGYGYAMAGGKNRLAHRAVYEALVEPIPEGLTLDHLCRVRLCVNPDHLEAVTLAENLRRARRFRGQPIIVRPGLAISSQPRERPLYCPHGHRYTEKNTYVRSNGVRNCRECVRIKARDKFKTLWATDPEFRQHRREAVRRWHHRHGREYAIARGEHKGGVHSRDRTHCPQGHPYAGSNLRITVKGKRECKECSRAKWRRWNERRKLEARISS